MASRLPRSVSSSALALLSLCGAGLLGLGVPALLVHLVTDGSSLALVWQAAPDVLLLAGAVVFGWAIGGLLGVGVLMSAAPRPLPARSRSPWNTRS